MNVMNYERKKLYWWNKNYFWLFSIIYIILNITIYTIFKGYNILWTWNETKWNVFNGIKVLMISFANLYTHENWIHVLGNMVAFSLAAFYLERKLGSLNFFAIIHIISIFSSSMTSMYASCVWAGSSVLYYGLWSYLIIDYIFSLKDKNKFNNILGLISIIGIYIGFCLTPNLIDSTLIPINLIYNAGHYYGFIVGIILALLINVINIQIKRQLNSK